MGQTHLHIHSFHGCGQRWEGRAPSGAACPPPSHSHDIKSTPKWRVQVREWLPSKFGMCFTYESKPGMPLPPPWCHHPLYFQNGHARSPDLDGHTALTHRRHALCIPDHRKLKAKGPHPHESSGVAQPLSRGIHSPNGGIQRPDTRDQEGKASVSHSHPSPLPECHEPTSTKGHEDAAGECQLKPYQPRHGLCSTGNRNGPRPWKPYCKCAHAPEPGNGPEYYTCQLTQNSRRFHTLSMGHRHPLHSFSSKETNCSLLSLAPCGWGVRL